MKYLKNLTLITIMLFGFTSNNVFAEIFTAPKNAIDYTIEGTGAKSIETVYAQQKRINEQIDSGSYKQLTKEQYQREVDSQIKIKNIENKLANSIKENNYKIDFNKILGEKYSKFVPFFEKMYREKQSLSLAKYNDIFIYSDK